ncbi:hypothetical protein EG329_005999 [Mollisiaceae sp. DMI_Dod_QoI]|nr:hypothetical protein EG329_005999 [Helotiales sp. DMI_Dod_QoI]
MRFHRARTFRRLFFVIIAIILLFILIEYEPVTLPVLSFSPEPPQGPVYQSHPVYEYTSLYRVKANVTFEEKLEEQLVNLETEIRSKLPEKEKGLVAKKRIWQITTPDLAESWKTWIAQWRDNNAGWEYKQYTSPPTDLLPLFDSIPKIAEANKAFPSIREDLVRYLILWYHGGFWTAIDTWDRIAMRDCNPVIQVVEGIRNVSLVIGVTDDEPYLSSRSIKQWGWTRGFGFGQAVVWAPRRFDPMLRKAIVRSISHAMVQKSLPKGSWSQRQLSKISWTVDYSGEVSGAGMFTDIVLEGLSGSLVEDHKLRDRDAGLGKRVTWRKFRNLKEVLWLEKSQVQDKVGGMRGLAVLPINVWGSGQNHSRSGSSESDDACVNHVHGWRPAKHKIFG